jgi:hypothetical protein
LRQIQGDAFVKTLRMIGVGAALVAITVIGAGPAAAGAIYSDSFLRTGPLAGSAPDVRPGTETWIGGNFDCYNEVLVGAGDYWSLLPFVPQADKVYTLKAMLNIGEVPEGPECLLLGFRDGTGGDWNENGQPWFRMNRTLVGEGYDNGNQVISYAGPGESGAVELNSDDGSGWENLQITLDTRNPQWVAKWYVNGAEQRSLTYTTNPTITYVGIGAHDTTGAISSFSLTPEPATLSLLALGGLAMLGRRNKRK